MTSVAGKRPAVIEPPLTDPRDLRRTDLRRLFGALVKAVGEDQLATLASAIAYALFLSLIPSTLAAIAIYGIVGDPADVQEQVDNLAREYPVLPEQVIDLIRQVLDNIVTGESNGTIAFLGVAVGIFSASGAAAALINGLNRAYGVREGRNFLRLRLTGLIIALALLAALIFLVVTVVLGAQIRNLLIPEDLQGPVVRVAFGVGQFLVAVVILLALFAFVYWIGPYRDRPPWQWISGGTVLGVLGWLVVSSGFALYTSLFGNFDNPVYGALGSVIVLLVWLQLSMLVVLLGAEVNAELEQIRRERAEARADALGPEAADDPADVPPPYPPPDPIDRAAEVLAPALDGTNGEPRPAGRGGPEPPDVDSPDRRGPGKGAARAAGGRRLSAVVAGASAALVALAALRRGR